MFFLQASLIVVEIHTAGKHILHVAGLYPPLHIGHVHPHPLTSSLLPAECALLLRRVFIIQPVERIVFLLCEFFCKKVRCRGGYLTARGRLAFLLRKNGFRLGYIIIHIYSSLLQRIIYIILRKFICLYNRELTCT